MIDIKDNKLKNKKKKMLLTAYNNDICISNKNATNKFETFEESRLNESKTLLYELNAKPSKFQIYKRGQIVRVKFGVNIGSEFSGDHFAIVISKKDFNRNGCIHVIPLTSKYSKNNLKIDNILYDEEKINNLKDLLGSSDLTGKEKWKINRVINYYSEKKNVQSYACINHMKTISKLSVSKTMFEKYDYLNELIYDEKTMKMISENIKKEYI